MNPEGEYKVTRGRYYTVSGKTPQMVGVASDIVVPGGLAASDIGEKTSKYPLPPDQIEPSFEDKLLDIPFIQRARVAKLYRYDLQPRMDMYQPYLDLLKKNSELRMKEDKGYTAFMKEVMNKDKDKDVEDEDAADKLVQNDFQLNESYNSMRYSRWFMT